MNLKRGERVAVKGVALDGIETHEAATVVRAVYVIQRAAPWYAVRFDRDGGRVLIHQSNLERIAP